MLRDLCTDLCVRVCCCGYAQPCLCQLICLRRPACVRRHMHSYSSSPHLNFPWECSLEIKRKEKQLPGAHRPPWIIHPTWQKEKKEDLRERLTEGELQSEMGIRVTIHPLAFLRSHTPPCMFNWIWDGMVFLLPVLWIRLTMPFLEHGFSQRLSNGDTILGTH